MGMKSNMVTLPELHLLIYRFKFLWKVCDFSFVFPNCDLLPRK